MRRILLGVFLLLVVVLSTAPVEAQVGDLTVRCLRLDADGSQSGTDIRDICTGTGTPEGNQDGDPGDIWIRSDGGVGTSFYVKETGTGTNTGWGSPSDTPAALVADTLTIDIANADARISRLRNGAFLFAEIGGSAENFEIDLGDVANVVKFESFSGANLYLWTASVGANLEIRGGNGFPGIFEMGRADTVIASTEVLGIAQWIAKDETSGGDANLPGAVMWAEATAAYDATNNPTDLHWCTSVSSDCGPNGDDSPDLTLTKDGNLTIVNAGDTGFVVGGYQRRFQIEPGSALTGSTAPTAVTIGTARGLAFDADAEEAFFIFDVPSDWDGSSDMLLDVDWSPESGAAIGDGLTVIWSTQYRSVAVGDAVDNGTFVTATQTYTQSGAGTDKELIQTAIVLDFDDVNQPISIGDHLFFQFDRDMTGDTYASDGIVMELEVEYTSIGLPR